MNNNTLVMIPAYNEERTVGEVVRRVRALYSSLDVLVINDGSEDGTEAEARKAGADVVTLPCHTGGVAAVLAGYLVALKQGYDYLVKIDGDGQHKPEDIVRVLEPVAANDADMCIGSRYLEKTQIKGDDSIIKFSGRILSSKVVNNIVKNIKVTDTTSGLRAWNRHALHSLVPTYLNERRFPDDSVLWLVETITAYRKRLKIAEIPIEILPRMYGKSKSFSLMKMLRYPLRLIVLLMEMMR